MTRAKVAALLKRYERLKARRRELMFAIQLDKEITELERQRLRDEYTYIQDELNRLKPTGMNT